MLRKFKVLLACWLVPLSSAATFARSAYPSYLKGITKIEYWSHAGTRALPGQRCAIDPNTWNTALELIRSQSSELKLIPDEEFRAQLAALREKASSLREESTSSEKGVSALDAARADLEEYGQIPRLSLGVASMEYAGKCTAVFRASLDAHVRPTDFIGTKEVIRLNYIAPGIFNPVIQIWHDERTLQTRDEYFAARVSSTAAAIIKTLADEWSETQKCQSC